MEDAKARKQLGEAIRRRRQELGYSQDSFADQIEMHRAYYSAIERGERNLTLRLMLRVASGLKITLGGLLNAAKL
ncbi:MAG TPA: helix-turn-helix transcriptional regulator [Burkholderiales bacterium]|nr:helix-turn-helix transcriptional regulator [Burkholderiales bacterium]